MSTIKPNEVEAGRGPDRNDILADRIARTISGALWRNVLTEVAVVLILVVVAGAGIYLLVRGATAEGGPTWSLLASGTACQAAIGWPVRTLLRYHRWTTLLQSLPELIRMSDSNNSRDLMYKLVDKLIGSL